MLGETRFPYLAHLPVFAIIQHCSSRLRLIFMACTYTTTRSSTTKLFIDIPNSHSLVLAETKSPYLLTNVSREQLAFRKDDSTPVSQSRHTLRFQPIACRSMRCPRVLTRPEMVWQAFVPDTASSQLAVFDMAEKNPGKRNCCYGQCKSDERYPVKCAGVTF